MKGGSFRGILERFRNEVLVWARVAKDPRTPWIARVLLAAAVVYLLSPVDLIPDFIPILGQLDDVLIVPTLVWLALKCVPETLVEEHRRAVSEAPGSGTGDVGARIPRALRYLLGSLGSLLVFFAVTAVVVAKKGLPLEMELAIQRFVLAHRTSVLSGAAIVLDVVGIWYIVTAATGATVLFLWRARKDGLAAVLLAALVAGIALLTELLKALISRERPDPAQAILPEAGLGFPSGHVTLFSSVCCFAASLIPVSTASRVMEVAARWLLLIFPLAMGAGRVYQGVHFTLDVVGGWFLGTGVAALLASWRLAQSAPPK